MNIQVEWAIRAKYPNDREGNRVLANSNYALEKADYKNLFTIWSVGNMPLEENRNDPSAPWITFTHHRHVDKNFFVVIMQEWANYDDIHGRRVAYSNCFLIPFEALAKSRCSLQSIVTSISQSDFTDISENIKGQIEFTDSIPIKIHNPPSESISKRPGKAIE